MENKFKVNDKVFFYSMFNRIPGIINAVKQNSNGEWIYEILIGESTIANNVPENNIIERKITGETKYKKGDIVKFRYMNDIYTGTIRIVDAYGTFEQCEEPSYDIMVENNPEGNKCFYKHIVESNIIGLV